MQFQLRIYENNVQLNYDAYKNSDKAQPKPGNLYVAVYLDGNRVDGTDTKEVLSANTGTTRYICSSTDIKYNENSGRVCEVWFKKLA